VDFGKWQELEPKHLGRLKISDRSHTTIMGLMSMHWSGYVREAALKRLGKTRDGCELPFLLMRLNDWVEQVRTVSRTLVEERLTPDYAPHFVQCLGLVYRLEECGRDDHAGTLEKITKMLQSDDCNEALTVGLASEDRIARRWAYRLATGSDFHNTLEVCRSALSQEDPVIRLWVSRMVVEKLGHDDLGAILPKMRADHFMPVRREALNGYRKLSAEKSKAELEKGLLDAHGSIREYCRFFLKKDGVTDFVSIYRQAVHDPDHATLAGAIGGLGETGTAEDVPILKKHVSDERTRVRKAAVSALAKLGDSDAVQFLLPYLSDKTLSVCRTTERAISNKLEWIKIEDLWDIYAAEPRVTAKKYMLRLFGEYTRWTALPYLLRAYARNSETDFRLPAEFLRILVYNWNRSFTNPTVTDLKKIDDALAEPGLRRDDPLVKEITAAVERWRPEVT